MSRGIIEACVGVIVALFLLTNVLFMCVLHMDKRDDNNRADATLLTAERIGLVAFVLLLLLMLYFSGYGLYKWIFL